MLTGILSAISNFFGAISGWFTYTNTVQQEKNSKEMVANKVAAQEQVQVDKTSQEIQDAESNDPKKAKLAQEQLRREWSED